jgi:uncharacterized protein YndB with AHSA1/START domain
MTTTKNSPTMESAVREFVIARTFDVPREFMFKVWTNPEHMKLWWEPKGFMEGKRCHPVGE